MITSRGDTLAQEEAAPWQKECPSPAHPLEKATVPKDAGEKRIQLSDTGQQEREREFIERSTEVALKIRSGRY
ncbi:hypothetical protein TNCV_1618271 [Trichonephila clavipes]|nr:hypothetical protein TNCV_1618271 [Trichonephila clavipes]